jgi:lipoprotein NlpI
MPKAIQLDPLLPQAHEALGVVYARLGEWTKSQNSFRRAIELDPKASTPRLDLAMNFLLPLGWTIDALWQVRTAEESDPRSPVGKVVDMCCDWQWSTSMLDK